MINLLKHITIKVNLQYYLGNTLQKQKKILISNRILQFSNINKL